jgi:DNA modification methylase
MNTLYLGDCLYVLRDNIPDESVDLVYIDPPFNSKRDYNIFFDDKEMQTQRIAFEDTWTLKNIQDSLAELHTLKTDNLYFLLLTYKKVAPHAFPYLTMMALRILELHRVLKTTGSFYLHCDSTMSHYLKTVCDIVFGANHFINEIIWERMFGTGSSKNIAKRFPSNTDTILLYSKSDKFLFNVQKKPLNEGAIKRYDKVDEMGRRFKWADLRTYSKERLEELLKKGDARFNPNAKNPVYKLYLDKAKGTPVSNLWIDLAFMGTKSPERLGYPTQKPKALLERIIQASSNEGDTVLDAFCGCGTTIDAAESLHRNWIGIDISPFAISLIKHRLKNTYLEGLNKFEVRGVPTTENSAKALWKQNPFAFEDWWLTEFEVFATTYGKKGADKGIDGIAQYLVDHKEQKVIRAAFQVKGGKHIQSKDIDALLGAMEKHKCELGVFLTITKPTKPMLDTVAGSGFVEVPGHKYPKLQILTLKEYYQNKQLKLPSVNITFKAAQLKGKKRSTQMKLGM